MKSNFLLVPLQCENLFKMNKKIPAYLLDIKTNLQIMAFVGGFSILFIIIFTPFTWFPTNQNKYILSLATIIGGLLFITASRVLLHFVSRKTEITYTSYSLWNIVEILFIAFLYSILNKYALHDNRSFDELFRLAILFIPLLLLIPYTVSYLYLSLKDKDKKLKNIIESMEYQTNVSTVSDNDDIINFYDDKMTMKLSAKKDSIYYVESSDNYVNIYYKKNAKITRCIIRNTLKTVEDLLKPYGFARCHRSYIVNLQKVQIVKKEHDGFVIALDNEEINDIPISKTYAEEMMQFIAK